jgi:hypothetical protein
MASSYSGAPVTYATGGIGNYYNTSGGTPGAVNTGNGAGGGRALGGSGIVIISYPNTYADALATTGSPTFTNVGGNKIYTFTGSGSITF